MRKILILMVVFLSGCSIITNKNDISNFDKNRLSGDWNVIASIDKPDYKEARFHFEFIGNNEVKISKIIKIKNTFFEDGNKFKYKSSPKFTNKQEYFNVVKIDANYNYALVLSNKKLWILSKNRSFPEMLKAIYLNSASSYGYNIEEIDWKI